MIELKGHADDHSEVKFIFEKDREWDAMPEHQRQAFQGEYLQTLYLPGAEKTTLWVGLGAEDALDAQRVMEAWAKAVREMKRYKAAAYYALQGRPRHRGHYGACRQGRYLRHGGLLPKGARLHDGH